MSQNIRDLSNEELIARVHQLEAHVTQLKNIISKQSSDISSRQSSGKNHKQFDFKSHSKRHIALKLLYLGWDYQGFAVQEDSVRTIEANLFEALLRTRLVESRETSNYHRCGRTDKGVSAFSQVISIDVRSNLSSGLGVTPPENNTSEVVKDNLKDEIRYVHILNKVLPPEIRAISWAPVQQSFSSRFDCIQRTYKYFFPQGCLNIELMRSGAEKLVGEHDFRNLCKMDVGNGVVTYMRRINRVDFTPVTDSSEGAYQIWELTVEGQAFLWHQIRCIVAVLFLIGQGLEQPDLIGRLLDVTSQPRKPQYSMASELPLVLFDCVFEHLDWQFDQEAMTSLIQHLQERWTQQAVRATIVRRMLTDLESRHCSDVIQHQGECLVEGKRTRVYKPLLDRQLCDSLENRIQHYAKRRKIQKVTQDGDQTQQDDINQDGGQTQGDVSHDGCQTEIINFSQK